ncbi:MAG TPA: hypothetical protein VHK04_05815, partial [Castellaniella sp.]|nr:hypothetical protein [Castellaniella sp.]
ASHFLAQHADALVAGGWPFIPVMPPDGVGTDAYAKERGKAPGYWTGKRWTMFTGWQNIGAPVAARVLPWTRWPACGELGQFPRRKAVLPV